MARNKYSLPSFHMLVAGFTLSNFLDAMATGATGRSMPILVLPILLVMSVGIMIVAGVRTGAFHIENPGPDLMRETIRLQESYILAFMTMFALGVAAMVSLALAMGKPSACDPFSIVMAAFGSAIFIALGRARERRMARG